MIDTPQIVESPAQPVAKIHLTIPKDQIRHVMGPGLQEIMGVLAAQGIAPAGPWLTHHLRMEPGIWDFEICVPVGKPVAPAGRVVPGEVPAARVARTVYHGDYSGLGNAWGELRAWIKAEGHAIRANLWERYVKGPESSGNPADWRTELNQPLV